MKVYSFGSYGKDDESDLSSILYNENINEESNDKILINGLTKNSSSFFSSSNTFNTENIYSQEDRDDDNIIIATNSSSAISFKSAQRQSMLKDSWDFYRLICSLLRDWHKYDEAFRLTITNDPLYPYLNSITGLNDTAEIGSILGVECSTIETKLISQNYQPKFEFMTNKEIVREMIDEANSSILQLIKVCQVFAKVLKLHQVGVGPVKEVDAAIRKAERKYKGDVLSITDYCRALLVVKDVSTLLAAIEFAQNSFKPLIRRIKLSALKYDNNTSIIAGGYRDCKINIELQGHICEIQIHLWPMWKICGIHGFRHYRHCLDYNVDSTFEEPFDVLDGIATKDLIDLISIAEQTIITESSLSTNNNNNNNNKPLKWYHEERILNCFAKAGLYYTIGTYDEIAEVNLRELIRLRCEHPDMGINHIETIITYKYLERVLRKQGKVKDADDILHIINEYKISKNDVMTFQTLNNYCPSSSIKELIENDNNLCCTNFLKSANYENKNKHMQQNEVIMESYKKWKQVRREKFNELHNDDVAHLKNL